MSRSLRFAALDRRPINMDTFAQEWPEVGLIAADGPSDPHPSLRVENGLVVEMDGKPRASFDSIDLFIADHALDLAIAPVAMDMPAHQIARMLVDINVPRSEIVRLVQGLSPARIMEVVGELNVVEMMMAMQKMRARRAPANQAHVTNRKDHPALLAADAAEAALHGFAEEETTVGASRYAPLNALAILVGSQVGRGGVITQCAVEEERSLALAMRGLTTYAETVSVYGTDAAFLDGDDTPWSKSFLASAYASRGAKLRFTSGTGSEVLMGRSEGKSMLYLEVRCLLVVKGAGVQGVQNGSVSCTPIPGAVPGGVRTILAENLVAAMLDLEVASGNDGSFSHSEIRKAAKLMLQFLPGTDLICSGYSSIPRHDNMFGGGNFDAEDMDDFTILQRDMQVDAGVEPITEPQAIDARRRGALALQAVFAGLELPPISDEEVVAATFAHRSDDVPDRDTAADLRAADAVLTRGITGVDVARVLAQRGFLEVAERVLAMGRQRISGDYLQTSAIVDARFHVQSAVNDANDYAGPGTGYRLQGERWHTLQNIRQALSPEAAIQLGGGDQGFILTEGDMATAGDDPRDVVVAVGPAFGGSQRGTIAGIPHSVVVRELMAGIVEEGMTPRLVRVRRSADCGTISLDAARLSGSGVGIGLQSKGTTAIHRNDLAPLNPLELFPQAQMYDGPFYRQIGRNAARHARGIAPPPVQYLVDPYSKPKFLARAALLHLKETQEVVPDAAPVLLTACFATPEQPGVPTAGEISR